MKGLWYCAFCGRYHTVLTKRYDFNGWLQRGEALGKDNMCGKGVLFTALFVERFRS